MLRISLHPAQIGVEARLAIDQFPRYGRILAREWGPRRGFALDLDEAEGPGTLPGPPWAPFARDAARARPAPGRERP